jgi:hypothetical protein
MSKVLHGETLIGLNPTEKSQLLPVNWHGHGMVNGHPVDCIVSAKSWFEAREQARRKLGVGEDDVVEIRIELTP